MNSFPTTFTEYAQAREKLLARIIRGLEQNECVGAAWLLGSYGRGEQDEVSDIDLYVVVLDAYRESLCCYDYKTASGAPASRLALFRQFGEPVNIHENHANAPAFWMMAAVAAKYIFRGEPSDVEWVLPFLRQVVEAIETLDGLELCKNKDPVCLSRDEQSARVRELYRRVIERVGRDTAPREQIEAILRLEKK